MLKAYLLQVLPDHLIDRSTPATEIMRTRNSLTHYDKHFAYYSSVCLTMVSKVREGYPGTKSPHHSFALPLLFTFSCISSFAILVCFHCPSKNRQRRTHRLRTATVPGNKHIQPNFPSRRGLRARRGGTHGGSWVSRRHRWPADPAHGEGTQYQQRVHLYFMYALR